MPLYESTFIARPDISSQQVDGLAEQFREILTESGGEVAKTEYWGLRSLAYRIKKNRKGHYYFMNIDAPPQRSTRWSARCASTRTSSATDGARRRARSQPGAAHPITRTRPRRPWRPRRTVGRPPARTTTAKAGAARAVSALRARTPRRPPMQVRDAGTKEAASEPPASAPPASEPPVSDAAGASAADGAAEEKSDG